MSETGEQRAARRRWLNLAELVAVAGVLIAAASLYLTYAERRDAAADKAATSASEAKDKARYTLRGTVRDDRITLVHDDAHELRDARVAFPTALGIGQKDATTDAITADWFAAPLLKLTDGGPDRRTGRLPVLVTYTYASGDDELTRTGLYDIVWATNGRFLRGRRLSIAAFKLHEQGGSQARLDALWAREKP